MIRVILADDHTIVRAGLVSLIEETCDIKVVAETDSGRETLSFAQSIPADVAVIDITMKGMDGLEVAERLRVLRPELKIIILSMHEEEHCIVQALNCGVLGYVTKRSAPEDLVNAIHKVYNGRRFLSEKVSEVLAFRVSLDSKELSPMARLSNREKQVLRCIAQGQSLQEIADNYHLSIKTVSTYRSRLLSKLMLKNNVELALFAVRNNIIDP